VERRNQTEIAALWPKEWWEKQDMKTPKDEDAPKRQAIREQIDENLKRVYTATLNEELPDRFRDLLAQLKGKDETGGAP
jgi:Anti-sigma factor NepR